MRLACRAEPNLAVGLKNVRGQYSVCVRVCLCVFPEELRQLLTHNELQIRAIQTLWEQHLQEALKDWEQQYANITQVDTETKRTT